MDNVIHAKHSIVLMQNIPHMGLGTRLENIEARHNSRVEASNGKTVLTTSPRPRSEFWQFV